MPDPASRFKPDDVHGASEVVDPAAFAWRDDAWRGRPWDEAVIYELHVGTFTPRRAPSPAVSERLDYLAELGVTAIELMPVADFPGRAQLGLRRRAAVCAGRRYGRPEDLKALVDAAHARGLMVLLDVVYNHFGPEGNYLHAYAPQFFTDAITRPGARRSTSTAPTAASVREFFIHNALYWLEEYHLDGLRLDAVHAIIDDSHAAHPATNWRDGACARGAGATATSTWCSRTTRNEARYLRPRRTAAALYARSGTTTCTMRCMSC